MNFRIADLFCGAGGASKGLHDAGFEVVGFDNRPQPRYPYEFHREDALEVDLSSFHAVWASPPCQAYTVANAHRTDLLYPELIEPTREKVTGLPHIIENVVGAPLVNWAMLCGTMFGLKIIRHRLFECSWDIPFPPYTCSHQGYVSHGDYAAVYGRNTRGPRRGKGFREPKSSKPSPNWSLAMGIDWMNKRELTQAIPPAYSEFLGKHLIKYMRAI